MKHGNGSLCSAWRTRRTVPVCITVDESALKKVVILLPIRYNYTINEGQSVSIADGDEVSFTFNPPRVYDAVGHEEIARVEMTCLGHYILLIPMHP